LALVEGKYDSSRKTQNSPAESPDVAAQDNAIVLDNVSKIYRLVPPHQKVFRFFKRPDPQDSANEEPENSMAALRSVSLSIPCGARVGLLGLNGAGKSTLLKIISRQIAPTEGNVRIKGTVQMLELGGGFTPERTGRQNVVASARERGFSREQIQNHVDYVEAFADIGKFFDQPMRVYSSGMRSRVNFGNAIALQPDVLICDEALSVGDARFAQKCFRRFEELQNNGCTILFASHDRFAIQRTCDLALMLHEGELIKFGDPAEVANLYAETLLTGKRPTGQFKGHGPTKGKAANGEKSAHAPSSTSVSATEENSHLDDLPVWADNPDHRDVVPEHPLYNRDEYRMGDERAEIIDIAIVHNNVQNPTEIEQNGVVELYFRVRFDDDMTPVPSFSISNFEDVLLYGVNTDYMSISLPAVRKGEVRTFKYTFVANLGPQPHFVSLGIKDQDRQLCDARRSVAVLNIAQRNGFVGIVDLQSEFCVHD